MVEKVMRGSWRDRPSFPFKHTAILSACSPLTHHTQTQPYTDSPALPLNSLSREDGRVLEASVLFSGRGYSRSANKNKAFFSAAALLRSLASRRSIKVGVPRILSQPLRLVSVLPLVFCLSSSSHPFPPPTMESSQSQITGDDGEECNSNESGWTVYLASPMRSDDVKENGNEGSNVEVGRSYINERRNGKEDKDMADDDDGDYDSLASDASTGPAQVKVLEGKEEKGHQINDGCSHEHVKDEQDEVHTKLSTSWNKKAGKMRKGDEKPSRRGHNKRRSSSRATFFW